MSFYFFILLKPIRNGDVIFIRNKNFLHKSELGKSTSNLKIIGVNPLQVVIICLPFPCLFLATRSKIVNNFSSLPIFNHFEEDCHEKKRLNQDECEMIEKRILDIFENDSPMPVIEASFGLESLILRLTKFGAKSSRSTLGFDKLNVTFCCI